MISKAYTKANNEFLKSNDPNKPTSYIYLDANTLYGHFMMQLFPLQMLDSVDLEKVKLYNFQDDAPIAYILEVDLDYPHKLHDLHNDYLLAGGKQK